MNACGFLRNTLFFCSLATFSAVIIQPSKESQLPYTPANTCIVFDVDGVLIDRPIAELTTLKNIGTLIKLFIHVFFDTTQKYELFKTVITMIKDRALLEEQAQKYDGTRIINWIIQRYPIFNGPTKSGISIGTQFKTFLMKATPKTDAIALLKQLHKVGYPIVIATNQGRETFDTLVQSGILPDFTYYALVHTIDNESQKESYPDEGFIKKPRKKYYKNIIQELEDISLFPEHLVFIDDILINIENAAKIGFVGIYFTSVEQTKEDLHKLGIFI